MLFDNDQEKFADIAFHVQCIFRYKKYRFMFLSFCHEVDPFGVG
jgi:hypothetical protein